MGGGGGGGGGGTPPLLVFGLCAESGFPVGGGFESMGFFLFISGLGIGRPYGGG